jgi:[ribosomal protein S18]-alanine N-acetyltransferase
MNTADQFIITKTTEEYKISICANMMSATEPWSRYGMDYNKCLKAFEGDFREIYVLETENRVVGFVILQICGTFKGYIQSLCISEPYRGRGAGKMLLSFCEKRILEISPNLFICVSSFNKGALKLYYEFGFSLVGELKDLIKEGVTELLLRKTYGPTLDYQPDRAKAKT